MDFNSHSRHMNCTVPTLQAMWWKRFRFFTFSSGSGSLPRLENSFPSCWLLCSLCPADAGYETGWKIEFPQSKSGCSQL